MKKIVIIIITIIIIITGSILIQFTKTPKKQEDVKQPSHQEINSGFLMNIVDVFNRSSEKVVVTGSVERGTVRLGDTLQVIGFNDEILQVTVTRIIVERKMVEEAGPNMEIGVEFQGIPLEKIKRGQVLATPNSIEMTNEFEAKIFLLSNEGKSNTVFDGFTGKIRLRDTYLYGTIKLPVEKSKIEEGTQEIVTIKLDKPLALEVGNSFMIMDGNKEIISGNVTKLHKYING